MPDPLLPNSAPRATAAIVAGVSPRTFNKVFVRPRLVEVDEHGRVVLASLERAIGKMITVEVFMAADRKRDPARAQQARYRAANMSTAP